MDTVYTNNACGHGIWDLHPTNFGFHLELSEHLDDEAVNALCCQLPLNSDFDGYGSHGSVLSLYRD